MRVEYAAEHTNVTSRACTPGKYTPDRHAVGSFSRSKKILVLIASPHAKNYARASTKILIHNARANRAHAQARINASRKRNPGDTRKIQIRTTQIMTRRKGHDTQERHSDATAQNCGTRSSKNTDGKNAASSRERSNERQNVIGGAELHRNAEDADATDAEKHTERER